MRETKKSFCRFCYVYCPIQVDVEDNRVVAVRGEPDDPLYHGYTCAKGRALPEQHNGPTRLRNSVTRAPDGSFQPIGSEQAMDEIAAKLLQIIECHGPRAVAIYPGAGLASNAHASGFVRAWLAGIGSPSCYSATTLDQPGKMIAAAIHGKWGGGPHSFDTAQVWMLIGCNPVVSMWGGVPGFNPWKQLRDAQSRGMKLIVVDPRRTEVAKQADLHLRIKPGEDPTLLAGIIRLLLLEEGLFDAQFCAANVAGVDTLREAVRDFTLDYVERRTGIPAAQVQQATRLFASLPRGCVTSGTGPDWAGHGNLTEYLLTTINTLCGRYRREGEPVPNPLVLLPYQPRKAQPIAVPQPWGQGPASRVRGLGQVLGEMPASTFADEILLPGEGQIKAVIVCGADPIVSCPDQLKLIKAFQSLELLVTVDPRMSPTAKLSHYVIAPKLSLERADLTLVGEILEIAYGQGGYPAPFARYTSPMVTADFDVVGEWEFFWGLAHRMRTPIVLNNTALSLDRKPTQDEVFEIASKGSRVPLEEVKKYPEGHTFRDLTVKVGAKDPGCETRLNVGHPLMMQELREVRTEPLVNGAGLRPGEEFTHRLISIRMPDVFNSYGHDLPSLRRKHPYNPAFMNPVDLDALRLESGAPVRISSGYASIPAIVEANKDVPCGVIGMAHSWGDVPELDEKVREIGSTTNRLIPADRDLDAITGLPRMSAIPVRVQPLPPHQ